MLITVSKDYGLKPWIAKITGKDTKFGFSRTFVGSVSKALSRSGATGYIEYDVEEGLYQKGGTKRDNGFFFVCYDEQGKEKMVGCSLSRATEIARLLDQGIDFNTARLETKP